VGVLAELDADELIQPLGVWFEAAFGVLEFGGQRSCAGAPLPGIDRDLPTGPGRRVFTPVPGSALAAG
jgi:hypothetical protein